MKMRVAAVVAASLAVGMPVLADDCDHTAQRQAALSAAGATSVRVIARAGSLEVRGQQGAGEVRARGLACASARADLDKIQLKATRTGNEIVIEAVTGDSSRSNFFLFGFSNYRRLDMVVTLPDNLPLRVSDGSGPLKISNVASLKLHDGSGPIEVADVKGDVAITDGSGEMEVSRVGGTVRVTDGSGDIEIRQVGEVVIESDGSGSIRIRSVRGSVLVEADGSGSIDVADVGGDFTVRHDGSGGISHEGVRGRVRLPRERD